MFSKNNTIKYWLQSEDNNKSYYSLTKEDFHALLGRGAPFAAKTNFRTNEFF